MKCFLCVLLSVLLLWVGNITSQTIESVRAQILKYEILYPDIVLRQAILETGRFSSYGCRKRNNLFGFRVHSGYLKFDTWQDGVAYYKRWQQKRYKNGDYYQFLVRVGYAEDKDYVKKLKGIKLN